MKLKTLNANELKEMNSIRWWHRIPVGLSGTGSTIYTPGEVNHGPNGDPSWITDRFGIPEDLTGKEVLDIGCWDGFFSFACEDRGAKNVVGIDIGIETCGHWGGTAGFDFAKKILKSKVQFKPCDIMNCSSLEYEFDLVLCYGVLYHMQAPLLAFKELFNVTMPGGTLLIETACIKGETPSWDFLQGHDNDDTNYWYPTFNGLKACLEWAGFINVEKIYSLNDIRLTCKAIKP